MNSILAYILSGIGGCLIGIFYASSFFLSLQPAHQSVFSFMRIISCVLLVYYLLHLYAIGFILSACASGIIMLWCMLVLSTRKSNKK